MGVKEPQTTFSACFGQIFLPLRPTRYAEMLGQKLAENPAITVWLINTGWTGGPYCIGSRMKLSYTHAMLTAALTGALTQANFQVHPVFGVLVPDAVPGVPTNLLDPRQTWASPAAYDQAAAELAQKFQANYQKYTAFANAEILAGAPVSSAFAFDR